MLTELNKINVRQQSLNVKIIFQQKCLKVDKRIMGNKKTSSYCTLLGYFNCRRRRVVYYLYAMMFIVIFMLVAEFYFTVATYTNTQNIPHKQINPKRSLSDFKHKVKKKQFREKVYHSNFYHPLDIKNFTGMINDKIINNRTIKYHVINPHPYVYLHQPRSSTCKFTLHVDQDNNTIKNILVVIKSSVQHFQMRNAIRRAMWRGVDNMSVHRIFTLGKDNESQSTVDVENRIHEDIVQQDFQDAYRNNTLKTIMSFNWVVQSCSHVHYILFFDDDYYVQINKLVSYLRSLPKEFHQGVYAGALTHSGSPFREDHIKWYIAYKDYPYNKFPPYVGGGAILVSYDVARRFHHAFPYVHPIAVDDAYLGIVANKLKINPRPDPHFNTRSISPLAKECSHDPNDILEKRCPLATKRFFVRPNVTDKTADVAHTILMAILSLLFIFFIIVLVPLIIYGIITT